MATNRRNPIRTTVRAVVMIAVGVGAYAGLEALDGSLESLRGVATEAPAEPRRAAPPGDRDGSGAAWLASALDAIERRASVSAEVVQAGWIGGELVETHGVYHRVGAGAERQFTERLQGRVAGRPARIHRVSDSRFLYVDIRWADGDESDRSVRRVDLRRVRRELADDRPTPAPGEAVAATVDPRDGARWGGVPMLLASLDASFEFGPAREMQLRGERVVAMVGRWRAERVEGLTGSAAAPIPARAPHHVVLALSKETLFPLLVEYRAVDDPMSAAGLPDAALLRPSPRPMLRISLLQPTFDTPIPASEFAYSPPAGVPLRDETDRELRIVRAGIDRPVIASKAGDAPR